MNVLFICAMYHEALLFRDLLDSIEYQGDYDVFVYNGIQNNTIIDDKFKHIMDNKVFIKECYTKIDSKLYFLKRYKLIKNLSENIDVKKFDFIHAHSLMNNGYVAYRIHKKYPIKYIVCARNTDINRHMKIPFLRGIANRIIENSNGVIFLSKPYREFYVNNYIIESKKEEFLNKSTVITNGVEQFWIDNKVDKAKEIRGSLIKLIFVGRIDKNKNISLILNACDELIQKGILLSLTVVGGVTDKEELNKLHQKKYVIVKQFMTKEDLIEEYRLNHIFVMPSKTETFGRVYLEAMSQGLPVIYTRGQGFDGQFDEGYIGYSVDSTNYNELADRIQDIMDDYLAISKRALDSIDQYAWTEIGKQTVAFYERVL